MVRIAGQASRSSSAGATISGGFVLVNVASLVAAWRACRARPLGIGDFRAWLACREMVARRCLLPEGRAPDYSHAELARLLGVTQRRAGASVGRLVDAKLLEWSDSAVGFPGQVLGDQDVVVVEDSIGGGRGSLVIPRRMLRLLAGGARPALIATALGVLLRCLSRRRGVFLGRGRLKASWVAHVFEVDLRRVKDARLELVALGWLEPELTGQRAENRWGRAYRVKLDWCRGRARRPILAPPPDLPAPGFDTPSVDPDPLPERGKDQEPAGGGPAGVRLLEESGKSPRLPRSRWPVPADSRSQPAMGDQPSPIGLLPLPRLDDVRPEDLRDARRCLTLYDQAVAKNLVGRSEAGRLRFLALAEHAASTATSNPGGLFASLLRRGAWAFIVQPEEDRARLRLRDHLHAAIDVYPTPVEPQAVPPGRRPSTFEGDRPVGGPTLLADLMETFAAVHSSPGDEGSRRFVARFSAARGSFRDP